MLILKMDLAKARVEKMGLVLKGIKVNADYKKYVTNADKNSEKDKPKKDKKRFIRTPKTKRNKKEDKQEPIENTKENSTTDFREVKEESKDNNTSAYANVKVKYASKEEILDGLEDVDYTSEILDESDKEKTTDSNIINNENKEESQDQDKQESKEWINEEKLEKEDAHIKLTEETRNADVVFVNEKLEEKAVDPAETEHPTEEDKPPVKGKLTNPKPPVRNQRKKGNRKPTTSKEVTKEMMKQELLNKAGKDSTKDPYIDQNKIINGAKINSDGSMEGFPVMDDMVIKEK